MGDFEFQIRIYRVAYEYLIDHTRLKGVRPGKCITMLIEFKYVTYICKISLFMNKRWVVSLSYGLCNYNVVACPKT